MRWASLILATGILTAALVFHLAAPAGGSLYI